MHEIDLDNLPRRKTYDWFNSFNNPTYGLTVKLDVTSLVEHTKKHNESFFINMLYIVVMTRKLGMCIIKICKENLAWRRFYEKGRNLKCKQKRTSQ